MVSCSRSERCRPNIADEGWDVVQHFGAEVYPESPYATGSLAASRLLHESPSELELILQVSQFPWGTIPPVG